MQKILKKESEHSFQLEKRSAISYLLIILLGEKVIQHVIVSLSFLYNIGDIRSTVAVDYRSLMISGVIIAILFVVALRGVIRKTHWGLFLAAFLAISDIVGEFIAQWSISPPINISILVAIVLLLLCYTEHRNLHRASRYEKARSMDAHRNHFWARTHEPSETGRFTEGSSLGLSIRRLGLYMILFTFIDSFFRYATLGIASVESVVSSMVSGALLAMVLGFVFSRLSYGRLTRIVMAWFSLFIIQSLSNLVEAVFFTTAIPTATIFMAALVFGMIVTLPEAILAGMLFTPTKWNGSFRADLVRYFSKRTISSWVGRVALGSIVYFPIYYTFGSIISPWILSYYDNPSQAFGLTIPPLGVMIPLQFLRGFLYIIALLPIIANLKGSIRTMILSVGGLIFIAGAFVPFIAYSTLPTFLRVVHGLEILADSIVYGAVLVYVLRTT